MHLLVSGLSGYLGSNLLHSSFFKSDTITDIKDVSKHTSYDCFIHLAWHGSPALDSRNNSNNLEYLNICYQLALAHNIQHFIFLSSGGAIYGHPQYLPLDEKHSTQPLSKYGKEKAQAEEFLLSQSVHSNLPFLTILRPSNIYGGLINNTKRNGFINILSSALELGNPITIYNPLSMRDYIHINDFLECLSLLLTSPLSSHTVYNVGSGISYSPLYILHQLCELTGVSSSYDIASIDYPDPLVIQLDISKVRSVTNWYPKTTLIEGLKSLSLASGI